MWDGPANRAERLLHCSETQRCSARVVGLGTAPSQQFELVTWTCDHQRLYLHRGPWCDHLFHGRPTCARSRCRCSRPERGQPKVPFSWCRCHILVIDYRWGSMGSDETAITILGGPLVIDVFDGNEAPSGPNCTLFSGTDRLRNCLWARSGSGYLHIPHTPSTRQPSALREPWKQNRPKHC